MWLNNPVRPHEASGTSGEKSAINGGLNCSISDGWWDEMADGRNGWTIPASASVEPAVRDRAESAAALDLLTSEIVPTVLPRRRPVVVRVARSGASLLDRPRPTRHRGANGVGLLGAAVPPDDRGLDTALTSRTYRVGSSMSQRLDPPVPALAADDLWRFGEGTHDGLAYLFGAHPDPDGTTFRVWAPSARSVSVIGDFNGWSGEGAPARTVAGRYLVGACRRGAGVGNRYKYRIVTTSGAVLDKSDPFAFATEEPPRTASMITHLDYDWGDGDWMAQTAPRAIATTPRSRSTRSTSDRGATSPVATARSRCSSPTHLERTGFTHVELMPVMEHPFYGSWGYQTTGYFAPTARYGTPQDLMFMIDHLHQRGFGVVLDWVPSHFPTDAYGLAEFDGTHLYEHADPRLGFHPDWKSAIFNYDRHEVRSFLLSSARFWLERYHADAIRVDAVASMLYRDYSRQAGEWIPNQHGGRENLGAIAFLQEFNRRVYLHHPDTFTVAEESTAWPGVTHPTDGGGLGFGFKWDMGWMNDTLEYFRRDPVHRRWHLGELTFRTVYAFTESFVLPLSHDEVVHGKGSLLSRQPGDRWQQFAGLRLLFGYQYGQPGKKLMFMGSELGMPEEWNHEQELPWGLLQHPRALRHPRLGVGAEPALPRRAGAAPRRQLGRRVPVGRRQRRRQQRASRSSGSRPGAAPCWWCATSPPYPAPATGSASPSPAAGRCSSTATTNDSAAVAWGTTASRRTTWPHGHDVSLAIDIPPLAAASSLPSTSTSRATSWPQVPCTHGTGL